MTKRADVEILEEIRRRRQARAESLGYDLKQIVEDLQRREKEASTPVVERPPRKPQVAPRGSSA
jgi:hypothetical protein